MVESRMQQKVSPRLVAASYILELSSMELQQAINTELEENPALEMQENQTCPVCGSQMMGSICPHCLSLQKQESSNREHEEGDDYIPSYNTSTASSDEEFDPLTQIAAQMTMQEYLLNEMQASLPNEDLPVAEYLVGNLDEKGYLCVTVAEVADYCGVNKAEVERVLKVLQQQEPVGIGARNLRECMLIQLRYLEERDITHPHVREIVSGYLSELGEHKFSKIAQELGISQRAVSEAWEFIKREFYPFPAHEFNPSDSFNSASSSAILPDVIVTKNEEGKYVVEVVESRRFVLRITPLYRQLASRADSPEQNYTEDEKRHIQQYVQRAKLFIANINQRRQTLQKISECIVEEQREFLEQGIRHLKPFTRAAVAEKLGMHESTVSRATAAKYIMLPSDQVIPFSDFFTASLSVKDIIKEFIVKENRPLTDQEIADMLAKHNIVVARRTVAKYREQLGILRSSLR